MPSHYQIDLPFFLSITCIIITKNLLTYSQLSIYVLSNIYGGHI